MDERRSILTWWRCLRLTSSLVDYAEGTLAVADRRALERHMASCRRCRAALAALKNVPPAVIAAAPARDEAFWVRQRQAIMQAVETLPQVEPEWPRPARFDWRLVLAPATALLIAVAGYQSVQRMFPTAGLVARGRVADDVLVAMAVTDEAVWLTRAELIPGEAWIDDAALGELAEAAWDTRTNREMGTMPDLGEDELDFLNDLIGGYAG